LSAITCGNWPNPSTNATLRYRENALDALYLATGGHPALVTYGLQQLWDIDTPTERSITTIFSKFQLHHREFLRDYRAIVRRPEVVEKRLSGYGTGKPTLRAAYPVNALQDACSAEVAC